MELVAHRERPAAAEPAVTSPVATDVTEQADRSVIPAGPDATARGETGAVGAIRVRSP